MRKILLVIAGLALAATTLGRVAEAHSSSHHSYAAHVARDSHGRIKRSRAATDAFKRAHPCPSTGRPSGACPGFVIDHTRPLACGGPDNPSNMQWQTTSDAKAKDKWERKQCGQ